MRSVAWGIFFSFDLGLATPVRCKSVSCSGAVHAQATGPIFEQMWFSVDVNGDGSCQFWEFAVWWRHYREAIQGRLLAEAARNSPVARRRIEWPGVSEEACA